VTVNLQPWCLTKSLKNTFKQFSFVGRHDQSITVSSAYCRAMIGSWSYWEMCWSIPIFTSSIIYCKTSMTKMNSMGEIGSPCLNLRWCWNGSVWKSLTCMVDETVVKRSYIHRLNLKGSLELVELGWENSSSEYRRLWRNPTSEELPAPCMCAHDALFLEQI
jgi:hypothetical protein